MRLVPKSFAGQLALLLLIALLVAQTAAFVLFAMERTQDARERFKDLVISRTTTLVRLLPDLPPSERPELLETASSRYLRFWISDQPPEGADPGRFERFGPDLARYLDMPPTSVSVVLLDEDPLPRHRAEHHHRRDPIEAWGEDGGNAAIERPRRENHPHTPRERAFWLALSVELGDGNWLNAVTGPPPPARPFGRAFLWSLGLSALAVGLVAAVVGRRMVRPMRKLADAAQRYGRGERFPPLVETGPDEARRSTRAFNEMRERLDSFVADRTRMLAAISHDLRTPITSLRLRAELVDDEETREKLVETLEEMQHMTEAALAFARADQAEEETRSVDITALVDSLVEDLAELGMDVTANGGEPAVARCRPMALRRAVRNVLENAVRYGERAQVGVSRSGPDIRIEVRDDGPGIPDGDVERMFEPFVRAESSRSRETGGIGLGLAIARTIMRAHGGDIALANRAGGGLEATLTLPAVT
ncbi:ATP-binding protein [Lutibaculum baratangense]|uniref:histidine kinase n=1 Tax=Lutibaculum baratangense AMV1 TaxID=631454 RepID=V4RFH1_9HYPH|nr:ATP-binding protein [Lutibaculum baratangense]ESR24134.1 sensor histidine kinase [Lutibaculum baratangense AMV1]